MSLSSHPSETTKLRFISPDVLLFFNSEMEKPHGQITCRRFWVQLCRQRPHSRPHVCRQEHYRGQVCSSYTFVPTIQTKIPPNEVPWLGIQAKHNVLNSHKRGDLFLNSKDKIKEGQLNTGKRVNYYKAESLG